MAEFGNRLRAAREARGLSLEKIARETRISVRFLEAIEAEEFDVLPGGVYTRGFIRSYAAIIGLDPDQIAAEYQQLDTRNEPEPVVRNVVRQRRNVDRAFLGGAAIALVVMILLFYVFSGDRQPGDVAGEPPVAREDTVTPAPVAMPPSPSSPGDAMAPALTIEMQVIDRTWLSLSVDGQNIVVSEILERGATRTYHAQGSIQLRVGNAAGLILRINEHQLPSLGKAGQVRDIEFTPDTVKSLTKS